VFVAVAVLAILWLLVAALPASIVTHFLPKGVEAQDLSGSIWHGAAANVRALGHDVGGVEWQLRPIALLRLQLKTDLHWAHRGIGLAGSAVIDRAGVTVTNVHGGGPIEDLGDLGLESGWRGNAEIAIDELSTDLTRILSARGQIKIEDLAGPTVAGGADLGNYVLQWGSHAVDPKGVVTGELQDAGGPLQVQGTLTLTPQQRSGMVSGTIQERPGAPAELHKDLEDLARMRGRDSQGRIPVDLEFSF
jgi:general secretion pathway protein N